MRKYKLYRMLLFSVAVFLMLFAVSRFFLNATRYSSNHTFFYELNRDSIDVVFTGSSHSYCTFSPMELYEQYGISSYNFGSSNQSMLASYLWAKEAYQYQHYKVLIVEAMSVTMSHGDVNNDIRSLSSMGMSPCYWELARTYKRKMYKVILPVFALHNEWENIGEVAYQPMGNGNSVSLRGYVPLNSQAGNEYTELILSGDRDAISYINFTYIDKLREFCEENGIQLVFVKALMASNEINDWNDGYHNNLANYAAEHQLVFIDFNMPEYLQAAGLDISEDVASDLRHMNVSGSRKVMSYLGRFLLDLEGDDIRTYGEDSGIDQSALDGYYDFVDGK